MGGRALACVKHPDQEESVLERNRRNRTLLFLAYALQGMVFYNPIATLYRLQAGVTLTQMQVIEGISLLVMLGLEVPWGRWADRIGHRRPMVLCFGVLALSKVVFWRAETVWGFLAERLLLSFARAGLSGCDTAYLYACCRDPEEHRRAFARWQGVQVAGLLLASLAWPMLGGDYRLSALLTVGSYTLALGVTLLLREPEGQRAEEQAREPRPPLGEMLRESRRMLAFLLGVALFDQTAQAAVTFFSQLQYGRCGIAEGAFGVLAALSAGAGLSGALAHRMVGPGGPERVCRRLITVGGAVCLLLAVTTAPAVSALGIPLLAALRSCAAPLALAVQNERVSPGGRAARLSCNAMVLECTGVLLAPVLGWTAEQWLPGGFLLGAVFCWAGSLLLWQDERRR
mgnify:CR=1 FL=1